MKYFKIVNEFDENYKKNYLLIKFLKHNNIYIFNKNELFLIKTKIDSYNNKEWNLSKKNINLYEYIYTSSRINQNISNIRLISRSYLKLHEIIKGKIINNKSIKNACCICDGPGGFIQCINDNFKDIDYIYGITLIKLNDNDVPYWNKIILNNKKNILLDGDGTGDIYNIKNMNYFINEINKREKLDLITCDGGFDFSSNYNDQENMCYRLLFCEIFKEESTFFHPHNVILN